MVPTEHQSVWQTFCKEECKGHTLTSSPSPPPALPLCHLLESPGNPSLGLAHGGVCRRKPQRSLLIFPQTIGLVSQHSPQLTHTSPAPAPPSGDTLVRSCRVSDMPMATTSGDLPQDLTVEVLFYLLQSSSSRRVLVAQSCPIPCNPVDNSPPGSPIPGILQARILEWVAVPFSRGSSPPRGRTSVSYTVGRFFTN